MAIMRILEQPRLLLDCLIQYRAKAGGHTCSHSYFIRVAEHSLLRQILSRSVRSKFTFNNELQH